MSLISKLKDETKKSLDWFLSLPIERQTYIITQLFKDISLLSDEEKRHMLILSYEIRELLISSTKEEIVKGLIEVGFDETLASIFVEKLFKIMPTPEMDAHVLNGLSNEDFQKAINSILIDFYGDYDAYDFDIEAQKMKINKEVLRSALRILRDLVIWDYLRGHISLETIERKFTKELGLSAEKVEILINAIKEHSERLRVQLMFGLIQDIYNKVDELNKRLESLTTHLKEFLNEFKKLIERPTSTRYTV